MNVTSEDSNEVALAVEAATAAVDYAADVQEMTESGTTPGQAGKQQQRQKSHLCRTTWKGQTGHCNGELQAHYAAKGKAKGSEALEPFADGLHEDGGETAEEEASENDMEVIPEEDEGDDGDDGGGDDGGAEGPATDLPTATTATEVAITSTTAGGPANVEEEVNAEPENVEEEVTVWSRTQRLESALPFKAWCATTRSMRWRRWSQEVWGNRCGQRQVLAWHQHRQRSMYSR